MKKPAHTLSGEHHIQQFHNYEHYPEHHEGSRQMWWDMEPPPADQEPLPRSPGFASGGSVIANMRKRKKAAEPKKGFGSHPLHGIPGIHIVGADAGEPVFTGEK